jgi:RNA polymerase sigma-70 factor (ECF subfamily)
MLALPAVAVSEEVVQRAIATATTAWPAILLDPGELRQSLPGSDDDVARYHVADLWLAVACARGEPNALAAFDRELLSRVGEFLVRHPARHKADEVRQILRERLLVPRDGQPPRIAAYTGKGPLASWLRVATLRIATNLVRVDGRYASLPSTPVGAVVEMPELRVLEARYRDAFRGAFRTAFEALETEDRLLLKLRYVDGVGVRGLAPVIGVSPATAARRLVDVQERLGERVLAQLAAATAKPADELASVVRALLSRLEVSLTRLLA